MYEKNHAPRSGVWFSCVTVPFDTSGDCLKGKEDMMKSVKIAVVGSINMDLTVTAEKIPKKGETVRGSGFFQIPGGKGANQAVAMARLGAEVEWFGCVGRDVNGEQLLANLKSEGVSTEHVRIVEKIPTGVAMITVGEKDNTIVVVPGANGKTDLEYVKEIEEVLLSFDAVVLQHEIPLEAVHEVIRFCARHRIVTVLNPAPAAEIPEDILESATWITPNEHEMSSIFGEKENLETILARYPEKLVVTLGSRGAAACRRNGELLRVPARPAKVEDTTGAGDTFNGAFAVCIAGGEDVQSALQYANTAASLSTEKFGAQGGMPSDREVREGGGVL